MAPFSSLKHQEPSAKPYFATLDPIGVQYTAGIPSSKGDMPQKSSFLQERATQDGGSYALIVEFENFSAKLKKRIHINFQLDPDF
jgi:hypothetical protein